MPAESNSFESSADALEMAQHADLAIRLATQQPFSTLTSQQNFQGAK